MSTLPPCVILFLCWPDCLLELSDFSAFVSNDHVSQIKILREPGAFYSFVMRAFLLELLHWGFFSGIRNELNCCSGLVHASLTMDLSLDIFQWIYK